MAKQYDNFFDFPSGARIAIREARYISRVKEREDGLLFFEVAFGNIRHIEVHSLFQPLNAVRNEFIERHKFLNQS